MRHFLYLIYLCLVPSLCAKGLAHEVDATHQGYFQAMYSHYNQTRDFYRHFIDYIKKRPDPSLAEYRIRLQQFSSIMGTQTENLVLMQKNLESFEIALQTLLRSLEEMGMRYMDSEMSASLTRLSHEMRLQLMTYHFLLKELTRRMLDVTLTCRDAIGSLEAKTQQEEERTWNRSREKMMLSEFPELMHLTRIMLRDAATRLNEVRNAFTYSDATLHASKQAALITAPRGNRKLDPAQKRELQAQMDEIKAGLVQTLAEQKIGLKVIDEMLEKSGSGTPPDLHLPQLSAHLFYNHTDLIPEIETVAKPEEAKPEIVELPELSELPEWI